ncbi:MAG: thioredoxin domain-containing protein [Myxococcota bacterium]
MANVADVTDANFKSEVVDSTIPVLIDFWGPNCPPCVAIAPHVEALATEHAGRLKVVKVNIHENMQVALQYKIQAMPTFVVLKGGREVARQKGTTGGIIALRRLVDSHL